MYVQYSRIHEKYTEEDVLRAFLKTFAKCSTRELIDKIISRLAQIEQYK